MSTNNPISIEKDVSSSIRSTQDAATQSPRHNMKGIQMDPKENNNEVRDNNQTDSKTQRSKDHDSSPTGTSKIGQDGTQPTTQTASDVAPDPFDPERLRLTQNFATSFEVKKALLTVPVKKPAKEWWVQTHPDPAYRIETAVLELKEEREIYLVDPDIWDYVATESTVRLCALFAAINRQGVVFLWPVRMPNPDGRIDSWSQSALDAATTAAGKWVRVQSNMSLSAYEVSEAYGNIPEPKWPDYSMKDLLRVAFKDRHIATMDHPVLQHLRGEK